ncbi:MULTISPECIES: hypothetical protein [Chryseobacterium]|uniref:hypothetical protein n=1 Tax=Chryseobacterium sp. R2A-55 TaxID=2744445 RepID=UPI001F39B597|nr:hypothetical protein [Chryseobacterium sp. R2A-55]
METSAQHEKLIKYTLDNQVIYTGFASYQDAEIFANSKNGKIVEVGFKDGNDNPQITDEAGLLEKKLHFFVEAGPEYRFIHSTDAGFRDYADELMKIKSKLVGYSPEEKYISNAEIEISEDPIIVIKNGAFESVTSRERSKYLKHAKVYEIGVSVSK